MLAFERNANRPPIILKRLRVSSRNEEKEVDYLQVWTREKRINANRSERDNPQYIYHFLR